MKKIIRKIVPKALINCYHFGLSFLGAIIYFFPSRRMKIIGVTGTNGKSTVVYLLSKILEEAGFNVASVSSIKFKIKEKEWQNNLKMTMPGRFKLQKFLRQALDQGCQYAVIEVTSEGILQSRHRFIDFDAVIFTNLTPEHIETHGSFEKYREAKGKLFRSLRNSKKTKKTSIINLDDPNSEYFLKFEAERKIGYGLDSQPSDKISNFLKATKIESSEHGLKFYLSDVRFNLKLKGIFNIYNALSAIGAALSQGIDLETCKSALEKISEVPGRMQEIIKSPFLVVVDYAHTPDALLKAYSALPKESFKICVLGSCGGGRDKWKRPKLGEIASQFCNQIILTNEDPYDDNPTQIIKEVASGIKKQSVEIREILERREAIKQALISAKNGSTVIITGKGSEPWMCVAGGKKIPWNDGEIVKEEFKKINN